MTSLVAPDTRYRVVGNPDHVVPRIQTHACGACGGCGRDMSRYMTVRPECPTCLGSGRLLGESRYLWPVAVEVVENVEDTPGEPPRAAGRDECARSGQTDKLRSSPPRPAEARSRPVHAKAFVRRVP